MREVERVPAKTEAQKLAVITTKLNLEVQLAT